MEIIFAINFSEAENYLDYACLREIKRTKGSDTYNLKQIEYRVP